MSGVLQFPARAPKATAPRRVCSDPIESWPPPASALPFTVEHTPSLDGTQTLIGYDAEGNVALVCQLADHLCTDDTVDALRRVLDHSIPRR